MQQRVQIFHRRDTPSSATQLPIMAALHAENLTLFSLILQDGKENVKPLLIFLYGLYNAIFTLFQISVCWAVAWMPDKSHFPISQNSC